MNIFNESVKKCNFNYKVLASQKKKKNIYIYIYTKFLVDTSVIA